MGDDRKTSLQPISLSSSPGSTSQGSPSTTGQGSPSTTGQGSPSITGQGSPSITGQGSPSTTGQGSPSTTGQGSLSTTDQGSPSTTGHGSPSTTGHGSPSTTGHGSPSTTGQGSPSTTGQGSPSTTGQGSPSTTGQGSLSTTGQGSPSTTGHGSPSTTGQGSPSTTGQGSPSTTGHGSPSTSQGSTKKASVQSELNELRTENSALEEDQITKLRGKIAAQNKMNQLKKVYDNMTHSNCCLHEACKEITQSGNYSQNITLDACEKEQSCYLQTCPTNESFSKAMNSYSFTGTRNLDHCGDSFRSIGSEFLDNDQPRNSFETLHEDQNAVGSDVYQIWPNELAITESQSQNTKQDISQTGQEVEKIVEYLLDDNANLSRKRGYSFREVDAFCLKNAEHDYTHSSDFDRDSVSTVEHERNPPARQCRTNSCRHQKKIRFQSCLKQNVKDRNVKDRNVKDRNEWYPRNAAEELKSVNQEVNKIHLLTETLAATLNLNNAKIEGCAHDITETERGVESSVQSNNKDMREKTDKKECLTGTGGTSKTENQSHDDYLLETSMKNLSVKDTNETNLATSNKAKEGSLDVVNTVMQEDDWFKDKNLFFTEEDITNKNDERYDDESLLKAKNENINKQYTCGLTTPRSPGRWADNN